MEFTAKHEEWIVGENVEDFTNENIAMFLSRVSNTVSSKIPGYLGEKIDVNGLLSIKIEGSLEEKLKALISPKVSRQIGRLVMEDDKKLKKLLVEVAKAVLTREILKNELPIEFPGGKIEGLKIQPRYEEDHINFTARYGSWIVVKRMIIDEKTPLLDIARLLASINETAVNKIKDFADVDDKKIVEYFGGFKKVKKEEEIKEIVQLFREFKGNEFEVRYAAREMLSKLGLKVDVPSKNLEKYLEKAG